MEKKDENFNLIYESAFHIAAALKAVAVAVAAPDAVVDFGTKVVADASPVVPSDV